MPDEKKNPPDEQSRPTPSQAEGDRETIERNLQEKGLGSGPDPKDDPPGGGQGDEVSTPSQAEGER